jgi:hypothetical protein
VVNTDSILATQQLTAEEMRSLRDVIDRAARKVARQVGVEVEDVAQEMWVLALDNVEALRNYPHAGQRFVMLERAGRTWASKERVVAYGVNFHYQYTPGQSVRLLEQRLARAERTPGPKDPLPSWDSDTLQAEQADLAQAWKTMGARSREYLLAGAVIGAADGVPRDAWGPVGLALEMEPSKARQGWYNARNKLATKMTWERERRLPWTHDGLGSRKVISNARAQAMIEDDYKDGSK